MLLGGLVPGKRDQSSHDAAIAKIAEALPHSNFIRSHLGEVLNSSTFKGSRRSREFLTHVVECALAGQWERLKERSLGIDIFSRNPSYDTGGDSIVRVTASDVRKRLLQYYSECPASLALRIEIPAGSYIPEFPGLTQSGLTQPGLTQPGLTQLGSGQSSGTAERVSPSVVGMSQVLSIGARSPRRHRTEKAAWLLVAISCGWVLGLLWDRFGYTFASKPESRYEFYRELLGPIVNDPAQPTEIALSNLLADKNYTEIGEAVAAVNVSQLMRSLGRSPRLREARFLNWGANVNMILLGAPQMSGWTQESSERANFTMEHDAIMNARPLSGERQTYSRTANGSVLDDYGLIWMARTPSGSRQLLMAGLTSAGTAGVSDFFCDPDRMRPVYEELRAASKKRSVVSEWQLLLHIHAKDDVPLQINVVSLRTGDANR